VKLQFLEAEMDEIAAPGILAYKGGDCFANLVSMINEIPAGRDISSATVESVLQQFVLSTPSDTASHTDYFGQTQSPNVINSYHHFFPWITYRRIIRSLEALRGCRVVSDWFER